MIPIGQMAVEALPMPDTVDVSDLQPRVLSDPLEAGLALSRDPAEAYDRSQFSCVWDADPTVVEALKAHHERFHFTPFRYEFRGHPSRLIEWMGPLRVDWVNNHRARVRGVFAAA